MGGVVDGACNCFSERSIVLSNDQQTVQCYCGACKVTVHGPPVMQLFCNCDDCRRWSGGIAEAVKLYPADMVEVTGDLLCLTYRAGSGSWRKSCAECGGAVVDDKSKMALNMIGVPAGLFSTQFVPTMQIQYQWKTFSFNDNLPKYKTYPKVFGVAEEELVDESVAPNPNMKAEETVSCYCGSCTVTVEGEPAMQVCCHCADCRRWGGAAFSAAKLYPADKVTVNGTFVSKDKAYQEGMKSWRQCCARCGGVVYDDKSRTPFKMIMIPAGLFNTPFTPQMHINYGSKIYPVRDGLPKYQKLPKAMGALEEELVAE